MKEAKHSGSGDIVYGAKTVNNYENFHAVKPKTLQQVISEWQSQTKPLLNPNLTLKSRDEQITQLLNLLSQSPSKIIVVSPRSEEESYAFIINALGTNEEYAKKVRVIISQEIWDSTIDNDKSLILLYQGFTPSNIGVAIAKGHFVVEAEESFSLIDKSHEIIELPKIRKSHQIDTFQEMGLNHSDAWKVYDDTKGFLYAIAQHPLLQPMERVKPNWINSYNIEILSTILFVNSWNRTNENDTKIIEQLSGMNYVEFEKELYKLKGEEKAPIRWIGNVWQVISKINLWDLIKNKISLSQIEKLKPVVLEVFSEIDPAYELEPGKRSYAYIYDKVMIYSGHIRENLADSLALLSAFGGEQEFIDSWLRELFENNLNVEAWYSYHHSLLSLAEASPNSFLSALEKSLDDIETTRIEELFLDDGDAYMGECNYCNLLWSLEQVSWNNDYLVQVVRILMKLSQLEIKSNRINQPFNSVKDIFLGWVPYSSATHQERIQILEQVLLAQYPDKSWKLLLELLPSFHMTASPINKPKYHNWDEIAKDDISEEDYYEYCEEINRLLFNNVDKDVNYWFDIFDNIENFYQKYFFEIIDKFMSLNKSIFDDEIRLLIANTLREKIHSHRSHPNSDWAIPKEFVDKLEEAFLFIESDNLIDKYQYLFDGMGSVNILNPIPYDPNDNNSFEKEDKLVEKLQRQALSEIIENENFEDLIKLIKRTSYSGTIGIELFAITGDKYYDQMLLWLESEDNSLLVCAKNYISRYIKSNPFDESILEGLTDKQKSQIILALSFGREAFEVLKKQNIEVQKLYWKNINWYYRLDKEDLEYVDWVIEQFYKYGFVGKTLDFISHHLSSVQIDFNILFKILYEINPNDKSIDRSSVSEIIKFLQKSKLKNEEIRFIEWKYLMLQSFHPIYWEKLIINKPKAFSELVSSIYKPVKLREEDKELTQKEIDSKATNSQELLKRFQLFREHNDIEPMTRERLKVWVIEAREAFKELDRVRIGDDRLGVFLAKSSKEEDGVFPNKIVCEIIEEFGDDAFEEGFIHEVIYPNGTRSTQKAHDSGGEQEHSESAKYLKYADSIKFVYPKTSQLLRKISDWYLREANREDLRSEL